PVAPSRRIESLSPRTACAPYSAQAIASRMVVLPEPFGPMIPVIPGPNSSSVSSCCRKFTRRSRRSCIRPAPPPPPPPRHPGPRAPGTRRRAARTRRGRSRRRALTLDGRQLDVTPYERNAAELDLGARQLHEQVPLSAEPVLLFVAHLPPGIGSDVLEAAGIPRIGLHLVRHMVVAQGDVVPLCRRELLQLEGRAAVLYRSPTFSHPGQVTVDGEHVEGRASLGPHGRAFNLRHRLVRHGEDRAIELRKRETPRW